MNSVSSLLNNRLDHHDHIAYDLDGTLFGIYGPILVKYIKDNPNKIHSILTSRQSTMIPHSERNLKLIFLDNWPFKHIIHSPSSHLEGHDAVPNFKGVECKRIGATALVDDWQFHSAACSMYNIDFVFIHGLI